MGTRQRGKSTGSIETQGPTRKEMLKCVTCAAAVDPKDVLIKTGPILHCEGSNTALGCYLHEPHHSTVRWAPCWKCGRPMGCRVCMPGKTVNGEDEPEVFNDGLWCQTCHVAANLETLLAHGVPAGFTLDTGSKELIFSCLERKIPNLGEYPKEWQRLYYLACERKGVEADAPAKGAFDEFRKALAKFRTMPSLKSPTKIGRRNIRNAQIAALGAK